MRRQSCDCYPVTRLGRADAPALAGFVATLDAVARHARFHRHTTPEMVQAHYAALDWQATVVLAWTVDDAVVAVAEAIAFDGPAGRAAELSVVVAGGWRGRGIGSILLARAMAEATGLGARFGVLHLPARDPALAAIARRLGGTLDVDGETAIIPGSAS